MVRLASPPPPAAFHLDIFLVETDDALRNDAASRALDDDSTAPGLSAHLEGGGTTPSVSSSPDEGAKLESPVSLGTHSPKPNPHWSSLWLWELLACVGLFLSLVAAIATVYYHWRDPMPQWPLGISINALLSIYLAIFRATLVFILASCVGQLQWTWFSYSPKPLSHLVQYSDATRGPWGALTLIWTQRLRQPLSLLAAVIAVSAVMADPFIQELVYPYNCNATLYGEIPSVPLARVFVQGQAGVIGDLSRDFGIDSAIAGYLAGAAPKLEAECMTGNCTFDRPYGTLGFCSSCNDVSNRIQRTCIDRREELVPSNAVWESQPWQGACGEDRDTVSRVPGANELRFAPDPEAEYANVFAIDSHWDEWADNQSAPLAPGNSATSAIFNFLASDIIAYDFNKATKNCTGRYWEPAHCKKPGAASCTLYLCARVYNGSVVSGNVVEELVRQSPAAVFRDPKINHISILDLGCINRTERDELEKRGDITPESPKDWIIRRVGNSDFQTGAFRDGTLDRRLVDRNCLYSLSKNTVGNMMTRIVNITLGHVESSIPSSFPTEEILNYRSNELVADTIYNKGDVTFDRIQDSMASISDAITYYMRTRGQKDYSAPLLGETQHYAICLGVQWEWIAFPATLALLTLSLLVMVMVMTTRQNFPVWKSSPLGWLLRGPGAESYLGPGGLDDDGDDDGKGLHIQHMEKMADRILVHMPNKADPAVHVVRGASTSVNIDITESQERGEEEGGVS